MKTHTRSIIRSAALSLAALIGSTAVLAGGPLAVFQPGQPYLWPNAGQNIPFNPDQGGLGPLTNAQAVAQTTSAFAAWTNVASSTVSYVNAGSLAIDVDETNFGPFLSPTAPDGLSAIVYDEDGAIFALLFGPNSGVLGFAGPEWIDTVNGTILEGVSFMNGATLLPPISFPIDEMTSVQVHEFGHYSNLAHTVINGQIAAFGDATGPSPFNTFPPPGSLATRIETMYPFLFINGGQATPHADDIAMISTLYPEASFATSTASISGTIFGPNGTAQITGANVIARNVADPYEDAVSAISSDFTDNFASGAPFVGAYTLRGLTPGASYAVYVDQIIQGGFSTPPRIPLPGPEEFHSANESNSDDPSLFTAVSAAAGATATGINVIFNTPPPGPLNLGDDATVELFPSFPMRVCGQEFSSLFVNSNGSVTFGNGDTSFSESIGAHLGGPPRIAGLWDDLNPASGGTVAFEETATGMTVSWTNVPEFPANGANSFSIKVERGLFGPYGNHFIVDYGDLSAADGLAGFSCGGKVTSAFEQESDLRRNPTRLRSTVQPDEKTAWFEIFTALDNDLDGFRIDFEGTLRFRDDFGNNDTVARAKLVELPYNSGPQQFTEIAPLGGDVDFYRFTAKAGDILAIETVPGNVVDTMIGIFDTAGNLLALDDDGGSGGIGALSRLLLQSNVDADFIVGVTTWPDFTFTGGGQDFGRYVLSIRSYQGALLPAGDDTTVEYQLGFPFPYQGADRTSVFVNSNGNLTFGAGNTDFSETVNELLAGPARIAPLWDDLNAADGLVIAEETANSLAIHYVSVPEFANTRPNYFTVELRRSGAITMDWGATARSDAIVGITEGGGAANPGVTDLSVGGPKPAAGTTYEQFTGSFSNFDLFFDRVRFLPEN